MANRRGKNCEAATRVREELSRHPEVMKVFFPEHYRLPEANLQAKLFSRLKRDEDEHPSGWA